ncbi:alpha/beta hydrolase family protein [Acinetobacter wuhouensis]|uniref:Hydrolase n=1 Tax=Acinetobacter wuhouensis TaxID=1879050 RepID=A0A4Q7AFY9_9GAMM|nr:hydrolase [Acinetobacter wuhouensis]RZG43801.1 hydrolase [Acinetobacter wuhouensis]RZG71099.1 hydrolase [Acinetobacter wuhouensis]
MNQKILLITGWGGGTKLLGALQQALQNQGHAVELINIFNALDEAELQRQTEKAKAFDVIIGWSLGGQLATLLVDQISRQYQQQRVLITLASNPCFVANDAWQTAMPQMTFQSFKQSFETDAIETLKKFGYMVCQGVESTKADFVKLQSLIQAQKIELLQDGLNLLEGLNLVDILKSYAGHQYHLFGKQDYLVSYKVLDNLQKLDAKFLQAELISGSHGLPVFQVELITDKICQYLQKIKQTS